MKLVSSSTFLIFFLSNVVSAQTVENASYGNCHLLPSDERARQSGGAYESCAEIGVPNGHNIVVGADKNIVTLDCYTSLAFAKLAMQIRYKEVCQVEDALTIGKCTLDTSFSNGTICTNGGYGIVKPDGTNVPGCYSIEKARRLAKKQTSCR